MPSSGSDSDESFDWEEERRRASMNSRLRAASARAAAMAERRTVEEARWLRAEDAAMEARLQNCKIEQEREEAILWEDSVERRRHISHAEAAAERLGRLMEEQDEWAKLQREFSSKGGEGRGEDGVLEDPDSWMAHEEEWQLFEQSAPPETMTAADVPWPPKEDGKSILCSAAMFLLRQSNTKGEQVTKQAIAKKAYRKATLRWHPDKFLHHFSSRFDESKDGAEAVALRFQRIAMEINEAWESFC